LFVAVILICSCISHLTGCETINNPEIISGGHGFMGKTVTEYNFVNRKEKEKSGLKRRKRERKLKRQLQQKKNKERNNLKKRKKMPKKKHNKRKRQPTLR